MKLKTLDFAAAGIVLLLALISALPLLFSDHGRLVEITADNNVYTLPLDTDAVHTVSANDHELSLLIENNAVSVTSHTCPDGLCAAMGKISKPGETIVCLPARVAVRIIGDRDSEVLDGIAG